MATIRKDDRSAWAERFYWTDDRLKTFSAAFQHELERALNGVEAAFSVQPSYLPLPAGTEQGLYLALTFAGTKVSVGRVRLFGKGYYILEKTVQRPVRTACYDDADDGTTAAAFFDFLAAAVAECVGTTPPCALGLTVPFAVAPRSPREAQLRRLLTGKAAGELLQQALERRGLARCRVKAVVNDAAASLLAAAYRYGDVAVGVVCDAGFTVCWYEPRRQMLVHAAAASFSELTGTVWDRRVDEASPQPGRQVLGKMIGGAYLAEIYRHVLCDYFDCADIPFFTTAEMNGLLQTSCLRETRHCMGRLWNRLVPPADVEHLCKIGASIFVRSAQLAGASVSAVLRHVYGNAVIPRQKIAVAGGVLTEVRGSLAVMADGMQACLAAEPSRTQVLPAYPAISRNGELVGAAVAAAMVGGEDQHCG